MSTKFTPGPWKAVKSYGDWSIYAGDTYIAAPDASESDEIEPNARLIAAAPDLLLAAKAIIYTDERGQGAGYAEAMQALVAAIAKAEGRQ